MKLTAAEVPPIREAMRDVQLAVASYYAQTTRGDDLGNAVRAFLASAQVVNDLLSNRVSNAENYKTLFTQGTVPSAHALNVVEGVKYARNVAQHVLHIVRPSDDRVLVGGELGLRIYAVWDEVPQSAHDQLTNKRTAALKGAYDSAMLGREVVSTMLDTLGFFQTVNADIVHRGHSGEWTGFPLMSQPGVPDRLHPEEPTDTRAAWDWLNGRKPNGDARIVCGQITLDETRLLCGFTFAGRHSFSPFVETIDQVRLDLSMGATYMRGDMWANVQDATSRLPSAQGAVFLSREGLETWTTPISGSDLESEWISLDSDEAWTSVAAVEQVSTALPLAVAYGIRRARRLDAYMPPRT